MTTSHRKMCPRAGALGLAVLAAGCPEKLQQLPAPEPDAPSIDAPPAPDAPAALTVVINDVSSAGSDKIELANATSAAIDISGWAVLDDKDVSVPYVFAAGTSIPAMGTLTIYNWVLGPPTQPPKDFVFGLGDAGDSVRLYSGPPDLVGGTNRVDATTWAASQALDSWCRQPAKTGTFQLCPAHMCGDGNREGLEECDGADLGGRTCTTMGFSAGTLACTPGCAFDLIGCVP